MRVKLRYRFLAVLAPIAAIMVIRNGFVSPFLALGVVGNATREIRSHLSADDLDRAEMLSVLQESIMQSNDVWMLTMLAIDVAILVVLAIIVYQIDARDQRSQMPAD